jgi:hypothetical protein
MSKQTVNVSQQLITSILIGFLIALVIVVIAHLFPKNWMLMPEYNSQSSGGYYSLGSKVSSCGYECMFGERHGADCSGMTVTDVGHKGLSGVNIFSDSFEHMSTILIIGLIASAIIYIIKRVSFKVVKE